MQFGIRCDANTEFGWGHFARCLTLATKLAEYGALPVFFMCKPNAQIKQQLAEHEFKLIELTSQAQLLPIGELALDCLVVDHYQLDQKWWQPLKQDGTAIMIMNDSGMPQPAADVVWDVAAAKTTNDLAAGQLTLYGPEYVLLRNEFSEFPKAECGEVPSTQNTLQLMICIGATDPVNTAGLLLNWLSGIKRQQRTLAITILSGSANPHLKHLQQTYPQVTFEIDSVRIAQVMAKQDLIVTAAGNMMWEAFSLGVPCALIKTCDNQTRNLQFIEKHMTDIYLGEEGKLEQSPVVCTLLNLMEDHERRNQLKTLAVQLCDGHGASRVARQLIDFIRDKHDDAKPTGK